MSSDMPPLALAQPCPPDRIVVAPARRSRALPLAAAGCLAVILAGQVVFAAYVLSLYGGAVVNGDMSRWNQVTPRAFVPGGVLGNVVFGSHVLFTVVVVFGGLVQLLPPLRRRAPALHRWNGRLYLGAAVVLALGGTAMILTRGTVGGFWQQAATVLNGAVILACAAATWRHARAHRIVAHRAWALRLFLCVSGVFFFRIGLMAWLLAFRAPVGFDPKTFSGPFLTVLSFAQFLLPLLVLQLVMHARKSPRAGVQLATAALLVLLAAVMAAGIAGATVGMWLPRL